MAEHVEQTFYWYDYETFGIDCRMDRPAQFAGIRTDADLNPIGEGEIFYVKPAMDYLPSPESCLLTGITPQLCERKGIPESKFAEEIWSRLNADNTCSIGYNSLGFDDEVNRFLFWRNFLDPYSHSYSNGCSRWDLFPLVCAVWALRGEKIRWVQWEDIDPREYPKAEGRKGTCFKLEFLSKANGIEHAHAHDALSDVYATIGLARLIKNTEPRLWDWAWENRTKAAVQNAVDSKRPLVWVSPKFGVQSGCTRIVQLVCGKGNARYMWDLMHDPEMLKSLSIDELRQRWFPTREQRLAGIEALPIHVLKTNASPFVCSSLKVLSQERAQRYGIDFETVLRNSRKLSEIVADVCPTIEALGESSQVSLAESADVDLSLYSSGFPSPHDKALFRQIRSLDPGALSKLIASGNLLFEDKRFIELLLRYRGRNWVDSLSQEEYAQWLTFCQKRLLQGCSGFLSVSAYFEEIDKLGETYLDDDDKQTILSDLYEWGEMLGERCSF